jgi:uncharacterized protein involved in exopolysaccharide biosynthesis
MQLKTWSLIRITVAFSVLGVLVAVAIFFALPKQYVSHSTLIVESISVTANTVTANTVIQTIAFDREYLASIIQHCSLYPRDRGRMSQDELIDKMSRNIHVAAAQFASGAYRNTVNFDIQFAYPDGYVAQRVNAELMRRLVNANLHQSSFVFRVLEPPSLPGLPEGPGLVRFGCVGLLAGILAGLLVTGLIKSR